MMLDAMEEIQPMYMNISLKPESLIPLVNNMLLITMLEALANQLISAKIALGHHVLKDKIAKTNAGLLTTRNITFLSITDSMESPR
jgi:hypothetical protein